MSNSLDPDQAPDQARHFVGSDLGQNVCKSYQEMTLVDSELIKCKLGLNLAKHELMHNCDLAILLKQLLLTIFHMTCLQTWP